MPPITQVTRIPKKEPDTAAAHRRSKPYTRAMINMVSARVIASPTQMGFQPFKYTRSEAAPAERRERPRHENAEAGGYFTSSIAASFS